MLLYVYYPDFDPVKISFWSKRRKSEKSPKEATKTCPLKGNRNPELNNAEPETRMVLHDLKENWRIEQRGNCHMMTHWFKKNIVQNRDVKNGIIVEWMKPRGEFCYTVRNMRLEEGNWLKTSQRSKNEFSFSTPAGGGKAPITVWHPPENRKMRGKETSGCIGEEFLSVSSEGKHRANFKLS